MLKDLTKRVGVKFAKKIYGIIAVYGFLLCMILIFSLSLGVSGSARGDTITIIEEVVTTQTITELVDQEVTTTQTITEIVDQEIDVEVTTEVQVEQVTPNVQEAISLDALSSWSTSGDASTSASQGSYCTPGEACTGHQGGTFSTDVDFEDLLSIPEINAGFDINYGVTVQSHSSNASLPLCSQTNGDCKDNFIVKLELTSGNSVVETFEDDILLDFSGTRDYTFEESIGSNSYMDLTGVFSFYGIDAGYCCGVYGPIFSDPYMNLVYDQIELITQQVTNIVTQTIQVAIESEIEVTEIIQVAVERDIEVIQFIETEIEIPDITQQDGDTNPLEVAELEVLELDEIVTLEPDTSFTVEVTNDEFGTVIDSFEVEVNIAETGGMATISIEDIGGEIEMIEIEIEPQVAEVEMEVASQIEMEMASEMEMEMDMEPEMNMEIEPEMEVAVEIEMNMEVESEMEMEIEVEVADTSSEPEPEVAETSSESESEPEVEVAEASAESESEPEVEVAEASEAAPEAKAKVEVAKTETKSAEQKAKTQQIKKQVAAAVAKRIMASIANNYDSASQATQLALMNVIGSPKYSTVSLADQYSTNWYASTDIYPQEGLTDPYGDAFTNAQGMQMDNLINSQY